ncbi:hypothetical protein BHAP_1839 [Bifidobacterium hapali]|uniref:Uncharacterized protein n=1 Tax=Bifidobacterium hapali TaxID=1630172 RepID=A0A261FXS4_9BIFI|nr:hypothetical protein BHAP_1839 [Bifidobacterium hapali]
MDSAQLRPLEVLWEAVTQQEQQALIDLRPPKGPQETVTQGEWADSAQLRPPEGLAHRTVRRLSPATTDLADARAQSDLRSVITSLRLTLREAHRASRLTRQPLTAPIMTPLLKYFWRKG